jgi:DNA-binding CsgD family transcriptional regulator
MAEIEIGGEDVNAFRALAREERHAATLGGLTARERTVTELAARGLSTDAIAWHLHISSWTVQDHLKAIFEKVGVRTRGELVAVVFFEHDAPAL